MARATGATYGVHFRRRREGRTDYEKRLAHLKGGKARLVVRKTNKYVIAEIAEFELKGDKVITSCTSKALQKLFGYPGKCNSPSAYLTGMLCAKQALKKGVTEAILDIGLHTATKGGVLFAALKGAVDAGLAVPHSGEILPSKERIEGAHLKGDAAGKFADCRKRIDAM